MNITTTNKLGAEHYDSGQLKRVETGLRKLLTDLFDDVSWVDVQYSLGFYKLGHGDVFKDALREYVYTRDINHQSFNDFIVALECPVELSGKVKGVSL